IDDDESVPVFAQAESCRRIVPDKVADGSAADPLHHSLRERSTIAGSQCRRERGKTCLEQCSLTGSLATASDHASTSAAAASHSASASSLNSTTRTSSNASSCSRRNAAAAPSDTRAASSTG